MTDGSHDYFILISGLPSRAIHIGSLEWTFQCFAQSIMLLKKLFFYPYLSGKLSRNWGAYPETIFQVWFCWRYRIPAEIFHESSPEMMHNRLKRKRTQIRLNHPSQCYWICKSKPFLVITRTSHSSDAVVLSLYILYIYFKIYFWT